MTTVFSDAFNRADSTTIGTPDVGSSWTERNGDYAILSNQCKFVSSGGSINGVLHTDAGSITSADHDVSAKITLPSGAFYDGLCGRRVNGSGDDSDGYFLLLDQGTSSNVHLFKRVSGSWTELNTAKSATLNASTQYAVKLSLSGTTIITSIDAVEKHNFTDASLSASGDCGLRNNGTTNVLYDDFLVEVAGSPPVATIRQLGSAGAGV